MFQHCWLSYLIYLLKHANASFDCVEIMSQLRYKEKRFAEDQYSPLSVKRAIKTHLY